MRSTPSEQSENNPLLTSISRTEYNSKSWGQLQRSETLVPKKTQKFHPLCSKNMDINHVLLHTSCSKWGARRPISEAARLKPEKHILQYFGVAQLMSPITRHLGLNKIKKEAQPKLKQEVNGI